MRKQRLALSLASGMVATVSLSSSPALAAGHDEGRGATIEEFVCFRSTGDEVRLGTGRVITTPTGNVRIVCTGEQL
ncbi:MAG: hypothetical protein LC808_32675 [Actinobacteria bacterium]|nr:hypothetical protein [Actinomycetota bacterium]